LGALSLGLSTPPRGQLVAAVGPQAEDTRLRRAQSLVTLNGAGIGIARHLISRKRPSNPWGAWVDAGIAGTMRWSRASSPRSSVGWSTGRRGPHAVAWPARWSSTSMGGTIRSRALEPRLCQSTRVRSAAHPSCLT